MVRERKEGEGDGERLREKEREREREREMVGGQSGVRRGQEEGRVRDSYWRFTTAGHSSINNY